MLQILYDTHLLIHYHEGTITLPTSMCGYLKLTLTPHANSLRTFCCEEQANR
uniref:Uncharacterized protein n=1 Tax=Octopus bimaculoides TaxID=37653 RepID=A0A0L8HQV9_OCTBM